MASGRARLKQADMESGSSRSRMMRQPRASYFVSAGMSRDEVPESFVTIDSLLQNVGRGYKA